VPYDSGMGLMLCRSPDADALLDRDPLALVIGMVLDQQIPLDKAFRGPYELTLRLGRQLDPRHLATFDPEELATIFSVPPALHRFPRAMAQRVQAVCRIATEKYDGDIATLWTTAQDGVDLLHRLKELPGFGPHKAQIFLALLGKQYGVTPPGWRKAAGAFGVEGSYLSIADIIDLDSLAEVRSYKQRLKAANRAAAADPAPPPRKATSSR
jgi:uncharacterized HhH-GPD family protein